MRGPNVMPGYHNKPEETRKALRDGWYHTGDLAKSDENGFLTITGRLKELIIRGGQNIAPAEIEEVVNTFEPVLDCAVVGIPHEHLGEVPALFVVAAPRPDGRDRGAARALPRAPSAYKVPQRRPSDRRDPAHRIGQDHPIQAEGVVVGRTLLRVGESEATRAVCSPPPCGEGLGVGVAHLITARAAVC